MFEKPGLRTIVGENPTIIQQTHLLYLLQSVIFR